jgi:protein-S-isoprenylcysteine O-methyltransferase
MTVWTAIPTATTVITIIWAASELGVSLLAHSRRGALVKADRASMALLWMAIGPSIYLSVRLGVRPSGLITKGSLAISGTGLALMLVGLAVRWAAILTLGRFFTSDVSIQREHRIVETGFYRYVRHPSYSGGLLTFVGFGLTFSNVWSAIIMAVVPTAALLYRISVEERALAGYFGDAYAAYKRKTKRLLPWIY